jgi:hypothetical protein
VIRVRLPNAFLRRSPAFAPQPFQRATRSLRASATIVGFFRRPPFVLTRSKNHWLRTESGWWRRGELALDVAADIHPIGNLRVLRPIGSGAAGALSSSTLTGKSSTERRNGAPPRMERNSLKSRIKNASPVGSRSAPMGTPLSLAFLLLSQSARRDFGFCCNDIGLRCAGTVG